MKYIKAIINFIQFLIITMENTTIPINEQTVIILKQWQTPEIVKIEIMSGITFGPESSNGILYS